MADENTGRIVEEDLALAGQSNLAAELPTYVD